MKNCGDEESELINQSKVTLAKFGDVYPLVNSLMKDLTIQENHSIEGN